MWSWGCVWKCSVRLLQLSRCEDFYCCERAGASTMKAGTPMTFNCSLIQSSLKACKYQVRKLLNLWIRPAPNKTSQVSEAQLVHLNTFSLMLLMQTEMSQSVISVGWYEIKCVLVWIHRREAVRGVWPFKPALTLAVCSVVCLYLRIILCYNSAHKNTRK